MRFISIYFVLILLSCNNGVIHNEINENYDSTSTTDIPYTIIARFSHDKTSFTEGLAFDRNVLYESSGAPIELTQTQSLIGIVNLRTGNIEKKIELDKNVYFGEGITIFQNKIFHLTYLNKICFVYDLNSYKLIAKYGYLNKEGWGLTHDNNNLIMSDGTNILTYINPQDFKPRKYISVFENNVARDSLNELEYIDGYIYANIWMRNYICKIDPNNGNVIGRIDLSAIAQNEKKTNPNCDVLNGIAYNSIEDKIYVTGKLYNNIYQINFMH